MMDGQQVGDLIEAMVTARLDGDRPTLITLIDGLMKGLVGDTLNVVLVMAGVVADEFDDIEPLGGFHRVTVTNRDVNGVEREGSIRELPRHVAIFAQMVAALANNDKPMAIDLFIGYVGKDGRRALPLVVFALDEVIHSDSGCPTCRPSSA